MADFGDIGERLERGYGALAAGERLLRQGGANDCLFIVESGALAVTRDSSDGSTGALLATLGPSEVVGDMSLLRGAPVSANVDASTTTGVLVIDASVVRSRPELFAELRAALE